MLKSIQVDISGTVVGKSLDCLLLSGMVVGENPDMSAGMYLKEGEALSI